MDPLGKIINELHFCNLFVCEQSKLWEDSAYAQAFLSLGYSHMHLQ